MTNKLGRGAAYRKNKSNRVEKTFEVVVPSGATFVLRVPDLQIFLVSGAMPLSIAEKMETAQKKGLGAAEAFEELSSNEKIKSIEFSTKLVRHICVSPKIVDNPQTDDEIAPEELLFEDFEFLVLWAKSGGEGAQALDTFRPGRSIDALDRPGIEEQRTAGE